MNLVTKTDFHFDSKMSHLPIIVKCFFKEKNVTHILHMLMATTVVPR